MTRKHQHPTCGTPDNFFDLIRFNQHYIQWSPLLQIKTSDYRRQRWNSTTEPQVIIVHMWCQINYSRQMPGQLTRICLVSYIYTLYRGHTHLKGHVLFLVMSRNYVAAINFRSFSVNPFIMSVNIFNSYFWNCLFPCRHPIVIQIGFD